jgi:hypothetical protein
MNLNHWLVSCARLLLSASCAVWIVACGGGGSGGGSAPPPPTPDARNGSYTIYATTGERFTLALDFDSSTYSIATQTSIAPMNESGTFSADGTTGSYVFLNGAGTGPTTRFRYVDDLVVGSYRFENVVQPFVGARRFAQSPAEAAGSYSTFGINRTAGVGDSRIFTQRIAANGTLDLCSDNIIYAIANCPLSSVQAYTLTQSGDLFTATRIGNAADFFSFRVAKAGTEPILLLGAINASAGTRFFRIGLNEARPFGAGTATGGTTLGEWGTAQYTPTTYSSSGVALDGHAITLTGTLSTLGANGPVNMRTLQAGGNAFAMQNSQLGILIGARNGTGAGYMQVGAR